MTISIGLNWLKYKYFLHVKMHFSFQFCCKEPTNSLFQNWTYQLKVSISSQKHQKFHKIPHLDKNVRTDKFDHIYVIVCENGLTLCKSVHIEMLNNASKGSFHFLCMKKSFSLD